MLQCPHFYLFTFYHQNLILLESNPSKLKSSPQCSNYHLYIHISTIQAPKSLIFIKYLKLYYIHINLHKYCSKHCVQASQLDRISSQWTSILTHICISTTCCVPSVCWEFGHFLLESKPLFPHQNFKFRGRESNRLGLRYSILLESLRLFRHIHFTLQVSDLRARESLHSRLYRIYRYHYHSSVVGLEDC